jgi:hypothetical protein
VTPAKFYVLRMWRLDRPGRPHAKVHHMTAPAQVALAAMEATGSVKLLGDNTVGQPVFMSDDEETCHRKRESLQALHPDEDFRVVGEFQLE